MSRDEYLAVVLQVAERDASIARVLREICGLPASARAAALDLVGAYLRMQGARPDVLACVDALRGDELAGVLVERLGPSG